MIDLFRLARHPSSAGSIIRWCAASFKQKSPERHLPPRIFVSPLACPGRSEQVLGDLVAGALNHSLVLNNSLDRQCTGARRRVISSKNSIRGGWDGRTKPKSKNS